MTAPSLDAEFPPLRSLDPIRHNLPVQLTSFIGREAEMDELKRLVFTHRLVTLTGTGGSGKTRLALQVGAEAVADFQDGVWFAGLSGIAEARHLAATVASALRLAVPNQDPLESLVAHFQPLSALLILDNCEHVLKEAAAFVGSLARSCPSLVILATSREPLRVRGERAVPVQPLRHEIDGSPTVESVGQLEAARLFRERVMESTGRDILQEEHATAIAQLCRRLDGIPLAIEQVASHARVLAPSQMLKRLERHFELLRIDEDGIEDRHRTLRATIDWSYDMLSPAERLLFQRASVFAGGFTLEACEAVCSDDELRDCDILALVEALIAKSLLVAEQAEDSPNLRYRMLETIREYAHEKAGEDEALRERHYAYFLGMAEMSLEGLLGPGQAEWIRRLTRDHDNLRKAMSHGLKTGKALPLANAMRRFWLAMGHFREGYAAISAALQEESSAESQAIAFNVAGALAEKLQDREAALRWYEKSSEIWLQLGRADMQAAVFHNMGICAVQEERSADAHRFFETSMNMYSAIGDQRGLAIAQGSFGAFLLDSGRPEEAELWLSRAISSLEALNHRHTLAIALAHRGCALFAMGRTTEAALDLLRSIDIWGEVSDPNGVAIALHCCAEWAAQLGMNERAAFLLAGADHLRGRIGTNSDPRARRRQADLWREIESSGARAQLPRVRASAKAAGLERLLQNAAEFLAQASAPPSERTV